MYILNVKVIVDWNFPLENRLGHVVDVKKGAGGGGGG